MTKKICFFVLSLLMEASLSAQNFQVPNGDFELWDGTELSSEPTHWNSFASSDGTYASMASTPHHYRRSGGRPGTTGSSYLTIYTKSILMVKANGNMTTGRIHAGSMSASSSNNYNYTSCGDSEFSLPFTATPDSIYMWVSYYAANASSETSVKAIIHGDNDFRDPNDNNATQLYAGKAVVEFGRTTTSATQPEWVLLKVPFVYDGTADPNYMLISLATNKTPGGGNANDSLSIDDIRLIYSSWLTDITLDGVTLEGFAKDVMDYDLGEVEDVDSALARLACTTEVADAVVTPLIDIDRTDTLVTATMSFLVTGEDGVSNHTYTVTMHQVIEVEDPEEPEDPVGVDAPGRVSVVLYPNPASRYVNIESAAAVRLVQVLDLSGRMLLSSTEGGALDLTSLSAGHYLVRVYTSEGVAVRTLTLRK